MARRSAIGEVATSLRAAIGILTAEPRYLVYALLVHAGFLLMFVLSIEWTSKPIASQPQVDVVQAVVVDETEVQKEIDRLREAETRKQAEEEARLRRQREEAQRAEQQRNQAEEQRRKAEEARKREEQRLAETKKQEEQVRRQAEQQRKEAEQQRQAEEKRRQEEARKEAERRAEEQKRREEEARRVEEQKRQEEAARAAEEQRRRDEAAAAERARREQSEVERYVEVIRQQVERNWNKPANWTTGVRCTVHVKLIPGGDVVDVRIVRSCGDPVFDSSVERAVYRASPLRVPPADSGLFDRFRDLEFVFNPQG